MDHVLYYLHKHLKLRKNRHPWKSYSDPIGLQKVCGLRQTPKRKVYLNQLETPDMSFLLMSRRVAMGIASKSRSSSSSLVAGRSTVERGEVDWVGPRPQSISLLCGHHDPGHLKEPWLKESFGVVGAKEGEEGDLFLLSLWLFVGDS